MVWQQGGGPWSSDPRGKSPGRRGPAGSNGVPPEVEEAVRRMRRRLHRVFGGTGGGGRGGGPGGKALAAACVVAGALWLGSGFYRVLPDEQGVVLRFGEYSRTSQPGLNYALPAPFEQVLTPKVTRVNRIEVGFRGTDGQAGAGFGPGLASLSAGMGSSARALPAASRPSTGASLGQVAEEALMLTGDENIVDVNFSVFWTIKDAREFLFRVRNPEAVIKAAAESAMREAIGRTPISAILAEGRRAIEADAQRLVQEILDAHAAGVQVTQVQLQKADPPQPVIDAFRDVQRARADQERLRNEAEAYRNDVVPRARGEADKLVQEAEAHRQEAVARAQGDAARFTAVLAAYEAAPAVTRQRLYLETKREVLSGVSKVLVDGDAQGGRGVLPYLPLPAPGSQGAAGRQPAAPQNGPQQ